MPRLSRWAIRTALVHLTLGFTFGGLILFNKGIPLHPAMWSLLPAHIEFLFLGWTAQLALGVAYWILPRFPREPKRGNVPLAWSGFILLNLGVLLVALAPYLPANLQADVFGRAFEFAAAVCFGLHAWPRVKPQGT
jgi:hypothetical protein